MITTVTLNASIDKLYLVDSVATGTVMRVQEVHNTAGGKGLNVARVAARAGERVRAMGFTGGYNGRYLRALLRDAQVEAVFTEVQGETRSCINIRDRSTGAHTEFLEPGTGVTPAEAESFFRQYSDALADSDVVTISGSVPRGTPDGFYSRLIAAAKSAGKKVILDTSGPLLREGVGAKPDMIKPNSDEIAQLLGSPASSPAELMAAARRLHGDGIAYVVVSLGGDGALMVCRQGAFVARPPDVPVVNTVGCGDSMVAGFAVGMVRGYPPEELLAWATAVAASNARSMLTGDIDPAALPSLRAQVTVQQVEII